MIEQDFPSSRKRLSEQHKLEIIGASPEDMVIFLHRCGAFLNRPWASKRYAAFAPKDDAADWKYHAEFCPTYADILNHLCHRNRMVALPRYWSRWHRKTTVKPAWLLDAERLPTGCQQESQQESRTSGTPSWNPSYVPSLALDVDVHNPEQRHTLPARSEALDDAFPWPHLDFISSQSDGIQRLVPVSRPGLVLRDFIPVGWEYRDDDDVLPLWYGYLDDLATVESIKDELVRIGFRVPGDVEVFPQRNGPLRLPLGPGSCLLRDDGWPVEVVGDAIAEVAEFERIHVREYPSLRTILESLRERPSLKMPWHPRKHRKSVAVAKAPAATTTAPGAVDPLSPAALLQNGLPGPDTRVLATLAMIRYFYAKNAPATPEELAALVWNWLESSHHGYSDLINKDRDAARRWVDVSCAGWFRKAVPLTPAARRARIYKRLSDDEKSLRAGDTDAIFRLVRPTGQTRRAHGLFRTEVRFIADFLKYTKLQLARTGADFGKAENIVEIPVAAWVKMVGACQHPDRPGYYRNRIALLSRIGLLAPVEGAIKRGQCRRYTLRHQFDTSGPVIADLDAHLSAEPRYTTWDNK